MNNLFTCYRQIGRTMKHKGAMLKLEKQFTGKISFRILIHDMDKVAMCALFPFLGTKRIHILHRKFMPHHQFNKENLSETTIKEMVLDWESARYTKPNKQETARQYCLRVKPHMFDKMNPYLIAWNI